MAKKKYTRLPICDVGVLKRFFAYLGDYYIGLLLCSLPIVLGNGLINQDETMQMNLFFFDEQPLVLVIIAVLSLLIGYVYYVHIPYRIWNGQTLAKRLLHFKIVQMNGEALKRKHLLLRHGVGMLLIEGSVISCTSVLRQLLTYFSGINLIDPWIYAGLAITIASCIFMLINKNHRMLHDYIANTMVTSEDYQKQ